MVILERYDNHKVQNIVVVPDKIMSGNGVNLVIPNQTLDDKKEREVRPWLEEGRLERLLKVYLMRI